jgi:hypothetical protein
MPVVISLYLDDDEPTAEEREAIDATCDEAWAEIEAGKGIPAEQIIAEFKALK